MGVAPAKLHPAITMLQDRFVRRSILRANSAEHIWIGLREGGERYRSARRSVFEYVGKQADEAIIAHRQPAVPSEERKSVGHRVDSFNEAVSRHDCILFTGAQAPRHHDEPDA